MVRTRCYHGGKLVAENFAIADVSDHVADRANTVWFDLCSPDRADLEVLREELGLHDLAIEDVLDANQRPKIDRYPEHLFLVAYSLEIDQETHLPREHEVAVFVTHNALVTVRADEGFDIDAVVKKWDSTVDLSGSGVAYLLHGLLDYVVDTHYDAVQALDGLIDGLEDRLFDDVTSDATMQRLTFDVRKSLVNVRRIVLPMREVVNTLLRRDLELVDPVMAPYFQDVYDHVLRVTEWTESLRDLIANILETRLTVRGNRLNVIMKKVTSWAAIIAVPTAVTGFYGQNLPYPGVQQMWGFWTSAGVILVASATLYIIFKRKDWL
jgi:magnesium transporter